MVNEGGDLLIEGSGNKVGPGHFTLRRTDHGDFFYIHYYDADNGSGGTSTHGIIPLTWNEDGWPVAQAQVVG